jgi:hypothetical protein
MLRLKLSALRRRFAWVPLVAVGASVAMLIPSPSTAQAPSVSEGVVCNYGNVSPTNPGSVSFVLSSNTGYISTPDGNSIFMWGFGLGSGGFQYVGPILCANEGDSVTITLKNNLPVPSSLNFPGITGVKANGVTPSYDSATDSLTTPAAANGGTMTYTFVADHPGTYLYESGTNPELQVLMGLVGAFIVRPTLTLSTNGVPNWTKCLGQSAYPQLTNVPASYPAGFVYDDCNSAYGANHEFMHLLTEIDPHMHHAIEQATCQAAIQAGATASTDSNGLTVWTPPTGSGASACTVPAPKNITYDMTTYRSRYWTINGRSFPDDLQPNFAPSVPTQPYGALVHILPSCPAPRSFQGATTLQCPNPNPFLTDGKTPNPDYNPLPGLVRFLNGGPIAYPFHPHGDHDSELGLDGRVLVNPAGDNASIDRFDVVVPPGQTIDATFGWVDAQQWDPNSKPLSCQVAGAACDNGIGVAQPQPQNLVNGPYWSGSPFLGQLLPLLNGTTQWNQCGEYYHFAHSHALQQVTNYGNPGGGMLTFIRVDPPPSLQQRYGTDCSGGFGYR